MKAETKYKGSIKLAAIGDALGWMTEFERTAESIKRKYNVERIDRFYDWEKNVGGRFFGYTDFINAGSYSDDTQLMLSVARSIKENGSVDHNYFSKIELLNWLLYARGGGRTVKNAAEKISRKSAKWNSNFFSFKAKDKVIDYRDSGANGAAMRILPIALANISNTEKINEEIFANSIVTHGHPRAILGAMLYGFAINHIITYRPENFDPLSFITQIGTDFHLKFSLPFLKKPEFRQWLKEWNKNGKSFDDEYNAILDETQQYLRGIYQILKTDRSVRESLQHLGCYANDTKGSGTSTVLAGIFIACKFHNKPTDAVLEAVNAIGTDTDSIAAFTGGLIGALHGQNIIPEKWKKVQDAKYLDDIAVMLLQVSEGDFANNSQEELPSLHKKINSISEDNFHTEDVVAFDPLGIGYIKFIDRQKTLTSGKYNLIIGVDFALGQYCVFSKTLNISDKADFEFKKEAVHDKSKTDMLLSLAREQLDESTSMLLSDYIEQNNVDSELLALLEKLIRR